MLRKAEGKKTGLIENLIDYARAKLTAEQMAQAEPFLLRYYSEVDPQDLSERSLPDLYGAALSHLNFARRFTAGTPKVRVYNPVFAEHSWQSTHSVVEIVNDDMPFLVDSLIMEANRHGLTLHLMVHPVLQVRRDSKGSLLEIIAGESKNKTRFESMIHMEVDRRTEPEALQRLHDGIVSVLTDVRRAVEDWPKLVERMKQTVAVAEKNPPPLDPAQTREDLDTARDLLETAVTNLTAAGAAGMILACTEMPVVIDRLPPPTSALCVDATRALAKACVAWWQNRA